MVATRRDGNPENEHSLLVFRVEGGGGDQRKVTTPKTSEALVSGLVVVASGHRRVVGVTRERSQPRKRAKRSFRGWWWLVGIEGWWWRPERGHNPENERSARYGVGRGGQWASKGGDFRGQVVVVVARKRWQPRKRAKRSFRDWVVMVAGGYRRVGIEGWSWWPESRGWSRPQKRAQVLVFGVGRVVK